MESVQARAWWVSRPFQWAHTGPRAGTYALAPAGSVQAMLVVEVNYEGLTASLSLAGESERRHVSSIVINNFFYEHKLPRLGPVFVTHPADNLGSPAADIDTARKVEVELCHGRRPLFRLWAPLVNTLEDVLGSGSSGSGAAFVCSVCRLDDDPRRGPVCVPLCQHRYHAACAAAAKCVLCEQVTELPFFTAAEVEALTVLEATRSAK